MRNIKIFGTISIVLVSLIFVQCQDDDDLGNAIIQDMCNDGVQNGDETGIDCGGSLCEPCDVESQFAGTYRQVDQMGRPGVNLFFNKEGLQDSLNVTVPYGMRAKFEQVFHDKIMMLDSTYTTNVLGLDAEAMAALFSTDVLWVAENGPTTYYNGSEILTGRPLGEDVMDNMLLWIFGGPDGTKNNDEPLLIRDGVPANDATFLNDFPYLAPPFEQD